VQLNRKTCTVLNDRINFEGVAIMAGIRFMKIASDMEVDTKLDKTFAWYGSGKSNLVKVKIDYSQKTMLTKGAVMVNLKRIPLKQKFRFIKGAIARRIGG
jgi:hypothetical protein